MVSIPFCSMMSFSAIARHLTTDIDTPLNKSCDNASRALKLEIVDAPLEVELFRDRSRNGDLDGAFIATESDIAVLRRRLGQHLISAHPSPDLHSSSEACEIDCDIVPVFPGDLQLESRPLLDRDIVFLSHRQTPNGLNFTRNGARPTP